ncbi:hypothetical protein ACSBL2_18355 [Pedobacter sp. AW31-3R]|uniref:hypothetical protein n=1 Tax=Pedobacter sp. AW31-3R TaxID=3445781 RepID=UPI003FA016BD
MENTTDKNTAIESKKHPEPSENIQMDIETVTPDAEKPVIPEENEKKEDLPVKENAADNNEQKTEQPTGETEESVDEAAAPDADPEEPSPKEDSSSAEQDNIETVTP